MSSRTWALEMALYNKWQNEVLYDLCDGLSDEDRQRDRGMFFASVHNTLDHILMVDTRLLEFVISGTPPSAPFEPDKLVFSDYDALKSSRARFDVDLVNVIPGWADGWLEEDIVYTSERLGRDRVIPRRFYLMQMFNHGTHHRSQVTSELHRMGIDYGITDLPYNPYSQY